MTFHTSQEPNNSLENFSQGIELDDPIPFGSDSDDDLITELFQYEDLNYTSLLMQTASKYRFSLEIQLECSPPISWPHISRRKTAPTPANVPPYFTHIFFLNLTPHPFFVPFLYTL